MKQSFNDGYDQQMKNIITRIFKASWDLITEDTL